MFTNRTSKILIVVLIVAIALLTVSFAVFPKASQSYPDYALRHPGAIVMSAAASAGDASPDYYQRHRAELWAARPVDTTDYFLRHPELKAARPVDTTDYFFRHPELRND